MDSDAKGASAHVAQLAEHALGKGEVIGSSPIVGSTRVIGRPKRWPRKFDELIHIRVAGFGPRQV